MTLYADLDVPADVSPADLRAAHRRAAKASHPDRGGRSEDFARVSRAWAVLSDPAKRADYDRTGQVDDGADNAFSTTASILARTYLQVIQSLDLHRARHFDVASAVRALIDQQIADMRGQMLQARAARDVFEATAARLSLSDGGPDVVAGVIAEQLAAIAVALAGMATAVADLVTARGAADGYRYRTDQTAAPAAQAFTWSNSV